MQRFSYKMLTKSQFDELIFKGYTYGGFHDIMNGYLHLCGDIEQLKYVISRNIVINRHYYYNPKLVICKIDNLKI
jgi:hypothetical protein